MTRLRLILGDQLNAQHSWFRECDSNTLYVIAELKQEGTYVKHHVQKLCAFFMAMHNFAEALTQAGHRVLHLTLDDTAGYESLPALLQALIAEHKVTSFEYQRPDEWRLYQQLRSFTPVLSEGVDKDLPINVQEADTEHFMLPFDELAKQFKPQKAHRMEAFYRRMRKRFNILMNGDEPRGGRWNYDQENRNSFKASELAAIPSPLVFANDPSVYIERIDRHGIDHFGKLAEQLIWPVSRRQALEQLQDFIEYKLPNFGRYQDAMTGNSDKAWSLYHARLSFALNAKMISPRLVIEQTLSYCEAHPGHTDLAQVEGFVRQILGWREYIRGMYWANAPSYSEQNKLKAQQALPAWFWDGSTKMNCMRQSIGQSLEYAYAHHIQRLMVIGNFALLAGIDPSALDEWYLGVYIDAIEWVEQPNTRGMSQFADGGLIASKPYAASGNYINKMSDYCADCAYQVKLKTGDKACPFNALYWHFLVRNEAVFKANPRMAFPYKQLEKMTEPQVQALTSYAEKQLLRLDQL